VAGLAQLVVVRLHQGQLDQNHLAIIWEELEWLDIQVIHEEGLLEVVLLH
jgi:hypothetical protein